MLLGWGEMRLSEYCKSEFPLERNLQQYVYDHPETIPIYELREDKRLLVAAREPSVLPASVAILAGMRIMTERLKLLRFGRAAAHDFGDRTGIAIAALGGELLPLLADGVFFGLCLWHGLPPRTEA
jgi:hypothetical protein